MIYYESGGWFLWAKVFKCHGSVFKTTLLIAAPCAGLSSLLYHFFPDGTLKMWSDERGILYETEAWAGFSFLVGFLIVFRTSQAYNRFWEGCSSVYRMRAEWTAAFSSLVATTKTTNSSSVEVTRFKELLVRLASMMHAAALAELEAGADSAPGELWAHSYEIIDPAGVDSESIDTIKKSKEQTELLFTWIQQVIAEGIGKGVLAIPAPILSCPCDGLAAGMVAFQDAMRISYVPFPFPYAQACDCILILHWILVPFVTSQWVTSAAWAAAFCFVQVFILWSLNMIAIEIDQPFGKDSNDIDGSRMQVEFNAKLMVLLSRRLEKTPRLSSRWAKGKKGAALRTPNETDDPESLQEMAHGAMLTLGRSSSTFGELIEGEFVSESESDSSADSTAYRICDMTRQVSPGPEESTNTTALRKRQISRQMSLEDTRNGVSRTWSEDVERPRGWATSSPPIYEDWASERGADGLSDPGVQIPIRKDRQESATQLEDCSSNPLPADIWGEREKERSERERERERRGGTDVTISTPKHSARETNSAVKHSALKQQARPNDKGSPSPRIRNGHSVAPDAWDVEDEKDRTVKI